MLNYTSHNRGLAETPSKLTATLLSSVISFFISSFLKRFQKRQQNECVFDIIGRVPFSRHANGSFRRNLKKIKLKPSKAYSAWI